MKLSDGREITIDLNKITRKEFVIMTKKGTSEKKSDELLGRCCGLTLKEVQKLGVLDYKRISRALLKAITTPLADEGEDPNSLSASTSD